MNIFLQTSVFRTFKANNKKVNKKPTCGSCKICPRNCQNNTYPFFLGNLLKKGLLVIFSVS